MSSHVSYTAKGEWCSIAAGDVYPRTSDGSDASRAGWWRASVIPVLESLATRMDAEIATLHADFRFADKLLPMREGAPLCLEGSTKERVWPCILPIAGRRSAAFTAALSDEQKDALVMGTSRGEVDKLGPFGRIRLQVLIAAPLSDALIAEIGERFARIAAEQGNRASRPTTQRSSL